MSDKPTNQSEKNREINSRTQLLGKVVLLIGNDSDIVQNLVTQFARKGADVVLLCWRIPLEVVHKIRESVQSVGRHLLVIEQETMTGKQLIEIITSELGRLDIFIDLSAQKREHTPGDKNDAAQTAALSHPDWQLTHAVFEEMLIIK